MKREFSFLRFLIISVLGTIGIVLIFEILIFHRKSIEQLTFKDFIPVFSAFIVLGSRDFRKYLNYKKSIHKGISLLNEGSIWGFDNLIISGSPARPNQIIVRNDLLWIEKHDNVKTEDLLQCLIADFENISRTRKFKSYMKNKSVRFNLYSSDLEDEQLLKSGEKYDA